MFWPSSMNAPLPRSVVSHRLIVGAVLLLGVALALVSYRTGRDAERERAEAEFRHRATLRQVLAREILSRFEDTLFGLATLFTLDTNVSRVEFARATNLLGGRITGAQAIEWVPLVPHEQRAANEASIRRSDPAGQRGIIEFDAAGQARAAAERPYYYPITYMQPLAGNEAALGFDLVTGPTRETLEAARASREMRVSPQIRLVQERAGQMGVVMVWPVFQARRSPQGALAAEDRTTDPFIGFLECVFRVHDLFETVHSRQPDTMLDMLFYDASETDAARRVLYHRPGNDRAPRPPGVEAEFRRGLHHEFRLPAGGRDWRVLFRPKAGWVESQGTSMPLLRSGSLLLLSGLVALLVHSNGRRTETIRREVAERTVELAESRRHFASMLHALPGMAYRCSYDEHLTVLFLSEGARALTGWTAEEFTNGTAHFRDCIHPDDLERVREATRTALQEQTDVEVEYRMRTKSGAEKWVLSRGRGIYGADGRLDIFEGLAIDITAQKRAESARLELERKLLEGQKLESLGLLAGGIAHDFNNLLSTVLGNANLARFTLPAGSEADGQLGAIETAALRAAELCRQMLAYAGKGRFVIEATDLTVLTEDLLPLLRISIAHQAALRLELARHLPAVMADATQLRQIVMNLVLNAADAIAAVNVPDGGEIVLTTGVMHADSLLLSKCVAGAALPRGDYVFLEVRDTGAGMTPEVIAKIFDPFFTTKFAGRGLGLAAVLGIVRGHQGALQVESTPGVGSRFRLLLPPARQAVAPTKATGAPGAAGWQHAGRVLVIEDEEAVRFVLARILTSFGLTPTVAADGPEGVAAFRAEPAGFDVVLLDLLMPGMNGEQTLAALRALRPDVRVLLISGYSEGDVLGRLGGAGRLAFLAKPFSREAIERKLRELLN